MRGIGNTSYTSSEYIASYIYILGDSKEGELVIAKILKDVYLIENLRIKLLIRIDILGLE